MSAYSSLGAPSPPRSYEEMDASHCAGDRAIQGQYLAADPYSCRISTQSRGVGAAGFWRSRSQVSP